MQVRFWGTRGSLPKPGPSTLRFGGNTACIEIRTAAGTIIVIDGGTGLHALGQALTTAQVKEGHLLISHTHWDHIQGIPFFAPFFEPDNTWRIYAPKGFGPSVEDTLAGQMQYTYFPVRLDQMGARITFSELVEGTFVIDDVRIQTRYLNHTALTLGFRLEADGATVVYASDHEPFAPNLASGLEALSGRDLQHCDFAKGADLLIHDAQFTAKEYAHRLGWGHSTIEYAVAVAQTARAARLALTHHDPLRTDKELETLVEAQKKTATCGPTLTEIFGAAEGQCIDLGLAKHELDPSTRREGSSLDVSALIRPSLVLAIHDSDDAKTICDAAQSDAIAVTRARDVHEAIAIARTRPPTVVIADASAFRESGNNVSNSLHTSFDFPTIVIVSSEQEVAAVETIIADTVGVLPKPFSTAYARSVIRAALMRTASRWQRKMKTPEEEERLEQLYRLSILDTPPEERFDRITRLAASIFDVPMALISLVDRDRQWFKSALGLDQSETSRETSFCSHAVAARAPLIVPDTFRDMRFADNPLVIGAPRIRFYAGYPLFVRSRCVGTLCILDTRAREIDIEALTMLRDLAAVAETELGAKAE